MARRSDLEPWEASLIKAILANTSLNDQEVLANFTRPGRDINHRAIQEVLHAPEFAAVPAATLEEMLLFLHASQSISDAKTRWLKGLIGEVRGHPRFKFEYNFFPVGQGLFSNGSVQGPSGEAFRWVFDCGTSEDLKFLNRQIAAMRATWSETRRRSKLDMLVISHFDEDHISGLRTLMTNFSVGTVVLPYIPPWDRLLIALSEDAQAGSDLYEFIIDPARFIFRIPGTENVRVVLVGPSDVPPSPSADPDGPSPRTWDGPLKLEIIGETEEPESGFASDFDLKNPRVSVLKAGGRFLIPGLWEFVPYNDPKKLKAATPSFRSKARAAAEQLRNASSVADTELALARLKKIYDKTFGSRPVDRNTISLFMYAGPIGDVVLQETEQTSFRSRLTRWPTGALDLRGSTDRFGLMLTGDAYLKTGASLKSMVRFFSAGARLRRGGCFQVMHHGSRWNWQAGLATKIDPVASIISSNPNGRYRHPHGEVLKDFARFGPKQVDMTTGWNLQGAFTFA